MSEEPEILVTESINVGRITLNRPKSLNAISYTLSTDLRDALKKLEKSKGLVILKGLGRAFCAGADIKNVFKSSQNKISSNVVDLCITVNEVMFILNTYRSPIVVLVNGIAFGGGGGLMVFAKYAVVTEKAIFSMPETKWGSHPNAGASYFFNRSDGKLGYYLGLTAESLKGADIVSAGFATHFCHSSNLEKLEKQLLNCSSNDNICKIIENNCEKNLPEFSLAPLLKRINQCFSASTIEDILSKLEEDGSSWAQKTKEILQKYSPTSLKVALRQLQISKNMDLFECLIMESNLTCNFCKFTDAFEGKKATLLDKSYVAKWDPAKLVDVTEELIENHFESSADKMQEKVLLERYRTLSNNLNKL